MRIVLMTVLALCCAVVASAGGYTPAVSQQDRMFPGTVFFTDVSDPRHPRIVEVDASGRVGWEYRLPRELLPGPRVPLPLGDATPLANGNVLFTVHSKGIFEIERSGKIVWELLDTEAAHDADRLPNGNTLYNRGWVSRGEDVVREVAPDGTVVWAWNGLPAFSDARFADVEIEGWMHVNACQRLADGSTLISIRNFHTVVRVDQGGAVLWSYVFRSDGGKGDLVTPEGRVRGSANHEPEFTSPDRLLVAVRRPHAVFEVDLATGEPIWSWKHPNGLNTIRDCNRLPNGNTLITGADRIVEITPDGEIVWEIQAPTTRMDKPFHRALKVGADGSVYGG